MIQLLLKTHLTFILIPLLTLAIEPSNPIGFCDRFVSDKDKAICMLKVTKESLDWYASAACSLQEDDKNFMSCLDEIKDASFHPDALELCSKPAGVPDSLRIDCIKKIKNKDYSRTQIKKCSDLGGTIEIGNCLSTNSRMPAGIKAPGFQALEIKK